MDTDPGIVCFQHCGLGKMFCLGLPDSCPLCGALLTTAHFTLLPFRVPYPFVRATQHPCSIVIRPSTGDFLNDYPSCKDLHIAVTSANGQVVEFDSAGLQQGRTDMWQQCLVVKGASRPWTEHWDRTLQEVSLQDCWTKQRYQEDNFNCYSFVLEFLQRLNYSSLSESARSRTQFCQDYIVPRTTAAGKYISLYRRLQTAGFYIHSSSSSTALVR